ncbi:hypothetical protein FB45DRAFT_356115 [Roridomyces roridus]|uniref:Uncharacterized protein n=1 Tax=Roridomyces roridus TaxID=1738132 RepID=A0AAD7FW60_9AGAR|nr:hypothetical protein FB45DRAFT_356115 [Roridomyces roridus]
MKEVISHSPCNARHAPLAFASVSLLGFLGGGIITPFSSPDPRRRTMPNWRCRCCSSNAPISFPMFSIHESTSCKKVASVGEVGVLGESDGLVGAMVCAETAAAERDLSWVGPWWFASDEPRFIDRNDLAADWVAAVAMNWVIESIRCPISSTEDAGPERCGQRVG